MTTWPHLLSVAEIGAAGTGLGVAWAAIRKVWPVVARIQHFMDDMLGEEARPGVDRRPGLIERAAQLERAHVTTHDVQQAILHELLPNSGSSLRDAVNRIEGRVGSIMEQYVRDLTASREDRSEIWRALRRLEGHVSDDAS